VPTQGSLMPLSFQQIEQTASCSFAGLRRVICGDPTKNSTGRALLVAVGLAAHVGAFGRSMSLRSGCELRPTQTRWQWLGAQSDADVEPLTTDGAVALVAACAAAAEQAGLPVGGKWQVEALRLEPSAALGDVITKSWPDLDAE
jgi:hypothetical protein